MALHQWKSSTTSSPSAIVSDPRCPRLHLPHPLPDEAFAAKHMPDLGHDVKDFKVFTWRLTNWKKLDKKINSAEFECGGHRWSVLSSLPSLYIISLLPRRILLFPFGNSNAPPNDTVSVYLDYADPKKSPEGWHACAQFALVISNPNDPTIYTVSRESHSPISPFTTDNPCP